MSEVAVADAKGFVYEPVRGPKRKIEFNPGRTADLSDGVNFY